MPLLFLCVFSGSSAEIGRPFRPASMVLEPVLREPGSITFQWLEIQRTRSSLQQQLEMRTNFSLNETLVEFGLVPSEAQADCDYKCPELDACIDRNLWCDGEYFKDQYIVGAQ